MKVRSATPLLFSIYSTCAVQIERSFLVQQQVPSTGTCTVRYNRGITITVPVQYMHVLYKYIRVCI